MPEAVEKEYRLARRTSTAGAACMFLLSALSVIPLVHLVFTFLTSSTFQHIGAQTILATMIGLLSTTTSVFLFGRFFWHFGHRPSPFGRRQSYRLLFASILLGFRTYIDVACPIPPMESTGIDGSNFILASTTAGPDLKVIVMIVFLICLAMVVRYGDALKEDSDSIA